MSGCVRIYGCDWPTDCGPDYCRGEHFAMTRGGQATSLTGDAPHGYDAVGLPLNRPRNTAS